MYGDSEELIGRWYGLILTHPVHALTHMCPGSSAPESAMRYSSPPNLGPVRHQGK